MGRSSRRTARVLSAFVALGIALRVVRYLLNFPIWCDESMLATNFLDRGYLDLLRPLGYRQVAPILFLWIELTAVRCLGFCELSLRLFPLVCSVASVPLFRHLTGRLLEDRAQVLAVAIFAVSGWPIRFGAEIKPYAADLLVALALLTMAVEWWRNPRQVGWLWALTASAPLALSLSFPAVFAAGGVSLGLAGAVWRSRREDSETSLDSFDRLGGTGGLPTSVSGRRGDSVLRRAMHWWASHQCHPRGFVSHAFRSVWVAYAAFNVSVALSFLTLFQLYAPSAENRAYFTMFWAPAFPPLDNLGRLIVWLVKVHTGSMFSYPEGGERLASLGTTLLVIAAIAALWKRRSRTLLALCLAPFGLGLIAAALRRYPYGQSVRTMQYLAPIVCILSGMGASTYLGLIRRPRGRNRLLNGVLIALAALGIGRMGIDLVVPYTSATDDRARAFARWFWIEMNRNAEVACLKADLGIALHPRHWDGDSTDMYLCNMKIYSPRHHSGDRLRLDAVSSTRPLRCVLFNEVPWNVPGFDAWLADMTTRYDLRKVDRYPVSAVNHRRDVFFDNVYFVYEFIPKPAPPIAGVVGTGTSRR